MNQLLDICNGAAKYPLNLPTKDYPDYELASHHRLLNDHGHRLFSSTEASELIFQELDSDGKGM